MADAVAVAAGAGTVGQLLAAGRTRLARAGCDTPRLDAELLLGESLDPGQPASRARLVLDCDKPAPPDARERFERLLARREAREPVAYILGRREFRRLTLAVDRRVLIPRPETELLVEVGLRLPAGASVLDVGTGSGAVALALKDERPDLRVRGSDLSVEALAVARANAARLGLDVAFSQADLLDGDRSDAILANLPYVSSGEPLAPEITRFEPPGALFAGDDGLAVVRRLIALVSARSASVAGSASRAGSGSAGSLVRAGSVGLVALEIAPGQAADVRRLVSAAGFASVEVLRDLAGLERVVVGSA